VNELKAKQTQFSNGGEIPVEPNLWSTIIEFASKNWLLILALFALNAVMLGWVKI
jgi:hypothetical protein